jgi:hypothetical protein
VGLDEERSLQRKVDTRDELLANILNAAAPTKKCEDQLNRKKLDRRTRVAKCLRLTVGFSNFYCEW